MARRSMGRVRVLGELRGPPPLQQAVRRPGKQKRTHRPVEPVAEVGRGGICFEENKKGVGAAGSGKRRARSRGGGVSEGKELAIIAAAGGASRSEEFEGQRDRGGLCVCVFVWVGGPRPTPKRSAAPGRAVRDAKAGQPAPLNARHRALPGDLAFSIRPKRWTQFELLEVGKRTASS